MNLLLDLKIFGWLLVGLGILETLPIGVALAYGEPSLAYVTSAAAALIYGIPIAATVHVKERRMRPRDAFLVVTGAWILASVFGALPYYFTESLGVVDAIFESVAGFTTTGSSVLTNIEDAPKALLLWRSITQWLGGMGIIVFTIAVLPLIGIGGMQLFKAEVPGPVTDKLTPRIADTARQLWYIYVGFTFCAFVALKLAGMGWYDAICHALTTLSTGGFSTRSASIAGFDSAAIEWVVIAFMMVAGINFALHFRLLGGQIRRVARDRELHLYLGLILSLTVLLSAVLWNANGSSNSLRHAAFQVVSLLTTTGYVTDDYGAWPAFALFFVVPLMILGGMSGSTSGGLKTLRVLLGLRALRTFVFRTSHPTAIRPVRYAGRAVPDDILNGVLIFFVAYLAITLGGAGVVASAGYDIETSISVGLTAIGNIGPALGDIGSSGDFHRMPDYVKLALTFLMIAGRLELFTVLVLFEPHFWKR